MQIRIHRPGNWYISCNFIKIFKEIWTSSLVFTFQLYFLSFSTPENSSLGKDKSGSAFKTELNPDPHWEKLLDLDPQKMYAPPQPSFLPYVPRYCIIDYFLPPPKKKKIVPMRIGTSANGCLSLF